MSADVIGIAELREKRLRRLFENGHAISNGGEDYGHELCSRCFGATYCGGHYVCPICGIRICECSLRGGEGAA